MTTYIATTDYTEQQYVEVNTGDTLRYQRVTLWGDATTPMRPDLCDGVVYRQTAEGDYLRLITDDGRLKAAWWGVKPRVDQDNVAIINSIAARLPEDTGYEITVPPGIYTAQSTLILEKRKVTVRGVRGATMFQYPARVQGAELRGVYGDDHKLQDLILLATGRDDSDGLVNGVRSGRGLDYAYNGVSCTSVSEMENVLIVNFSGNGVIHNANIGDRNALYPNGTDASHAQLRRVHVRSCGGNGFYAVGSDANAIGYFWCSARDSGLANYADASFLGNYYFGCMAHRANVWNLPNGPGHYMLTDPNNYGTVVGCYGEGDSPKSVAAGLATVQGGLHYNGWVTSQFSCVQQGNRFSSITLGGLSFAPDEIRFASSGSGGYSAMFFRNRDPSGNTTIWQLATSEQQGNYAGLYFFQPGAAPPGLQAQGREGVAIEWLYMGDVLHHSMNTHGRNFSFNQDLPSLLTYKRGAYIEFDDREEAYPRGLRCVQPGQGAAARWMADGDGRGTTDERPSSANANYSLFYDPARPQLINHDMYVGWGFYDRTLRLKVWWDGANWRDATGTIR